jgi:hypothetical protein
VPKILSYEKAAHEKLMKLIPNLFLQQKQSFEGGGILVHSNKRL